jgi:hypothetical protein
VESIRWSAGRIQQTLWEYGRPRKTHPKGTGFIFKLYAAAGMPDHLAQEFERTFLSPLDSRAADALFAMDNGSNFTTAQRLAWASFVATLLSRMPEDIVLLKQTIKELAELVLPKLRLIYENFTPTSDGRTYGDLSDELIRNSDQRAIVLAKRVMTNERMVRAIASMEWSVLTLENARFELLTSDRPVIYTNELGHPQSHFIMPIGPRRLFMAAKNRELIQRFRGVGQSALQISANAKVTESASKYVFGSDDSQLRFVQNRMGTAKDPTLVERMRDIQSEKYAPLLNNLDEAVNEELMGK